MDFIRGLKKVTWALGKQSRFKWMSEIGKKARSPTKGGFLHTSRAQSRENVRKKLVCVIFLKLYIL